jgi:hypothetical protein
MKWIFILVNISILAACQPLNTDAVEAHQIAASPTKTWLSWLHIGHEKPIDVTQEKAISYHPCSEKSPD